MIYSAEVQNMCSVAKGAYHGNIVVFIIYFLFVYYTINDSDN